MPGTRKPIREFGRVYDYLKDVDLRLKEIGKKRVTIENAEFAGEEFINAYWGFYDFVNCHFPASHNIFLKQLAECTLTDCEFGPSRDDDSIQFGKSRNSVFKRCKIIGGSLVFYGNAQFEECEFDSLSPDLDHRHILAGDDTTLIKCKASNYTWRGDEKLTVHDCVFGVGRLSSGLTKNVSNDFIITNSIFENAEEILWGTKVKNLTMSRCVAKEVFRAQGLIVEDMALYEHLKEGFFDFSGVGYHGKLRVRNCNFSATGKRTKNKEVHVFIVNGMGAVDTLIENVVCHSDKSANLSGAYAETTADIFKTPLKNEICVIRNCKIPYVQLNWMHTKHLRLENCEIGQLEIRDGQIGKLEIVKTKFARLDLSRTVAIEYALDVSGEVVDTGSNYDKATGKARKK